MQKNPIDVKERMSLIALAAFCAAAFVMVLIGVFALHTPVVAMCALIFLEAGIAVMMHKAMLWVHGGMVIAEVIAGVLTGRVVLIILCIVVYVAATAALQVFAKDEQGVC